MDLLDETRQLLGRRSCSQMDVAIGASVSQKFVSDLERGEYMENVSYQRLLRVRDFLLKHRRRA